jgi:hypothetical protein
VDPALALQAVSAARVLISLWVSLLIMLGWFSPALVRRERRCEAAEEGVSVPEFPGQARAGLRAAYGKLPVTGIPRITRPRRKQGAAGGFTVVDPGGNWLRVSSQTAELESAR